MQSPLELEPELVSLLGLITARWAAMEEALADLLGRFMRVDHAGHATLFSLANFSQRLALISSTALYSVESERDLKIITKLLGKINDLWLNRNNFVHSHYVHRTVYTDGAEVMLIADSGEGLTEKAIEAGHRPVKSHSFGYLKRKRGGDADFVPVNRGTFKNHADKVARRTRQVLTAAKAVDTGIVALRPDSPTTYRRLSPRSPRFKETPPIEGPFTVRVLPSRRKNKDGDSPG
jgi:hypothetical protein